MSARRNFIIQPVLLLQKLRFQVASHQSEIDVLRASHQSQVIEMGNTISSVAAERDVLRDTIKTFDADGIQSMTDGALLNNKQVVDNISNAYNTEIIRRYKEQTTQKRTKRRLVVCHPAGTTLVQDVATAEDPRPASP